MQQAVTLAQDKSQHYSVTGAAVTGAKLVILSVVLIQFFDVTLFNIGSFEITAQKIVLSVSIPLGILLMLKLLVPFPLLILTTLFGVGMTLPNLKSDSPGTSIAYAALVLLVASVFVTAFRVHPQPLSFFSKAWISLTVFSSVVTIFQAFGWLPLFNVDAESLGARLAFGETYRATGFKFDPNFQALILSIGFLLILYSSRGKTRVLLSVLAAVGVAATFSRMGIILVLVSLLLFGFGTTESRATLGARLRRIAGVGVGVAVAVLGVILWAPQTVSNFFEQRVIELWSGIAQLAGFVPDVSISAGSAGTRSNLLVAGFSVGIDYFPLGIGSEQFLAEMYRRTGLLNIAHNTYVEFFAVAGVLGIGFLALYAWLFLLNIRSRRFVSNDDSYLIVSGLGILLGVAGLMLSFSENMILWIPLMVSFGVVLSPVRGDLIR